MFNGCVMQNKDWQIFVCLLGVCSRGVSYRIFKKKKIFDNSTVTDVMDILLSSFQIVLKKKRGGMFTKKNASDRAVGQQGNGKAESNSHFRVSAFQHVHLLQTCLIPCFETQSKWEGV